MLVIDYLLEHALDNIEFITAYNDLFAFVQCPQRLELGLDTRTSPIERKSI